MHGGPSQIETFDPKMSAPVEVRSATGEVATRLPGVTFGGTFPKLARLADRLTVVRSYTGGDGNHDIKPVVGRDTSGANLGSIYAHVAGMNHPVSGLPTNALLLPRAVDPTTQAGTTAFGKFDATGTLSPALAPFAPGAGGSLQQDMKLKLPADRLDDRQRLLATPRPRRRRPRRGRARRPRRPARQGVSHHPRRRRRRLRPVEGERQDRGPLRHRPAGPTGEHRQEMEAITTTTSITPSRWAS